MDDSDAMHIEIKMSLYIFNVGLRFAFNISDQERPFHTISGMVSRVRILWVMLHHSPKLKSFGFFLFSSIQIRPTEMRFSQSAGR